MKKFLEYLPGIYQESSDDSENSLGLFLSSFEEVLFSQENGLESRIANSYKIFDPQDTPNEFLSWLAGWVSLSLRADLSEKEQHNYLGEIVQRYRDRGTQKNLERLLEIFKVAQPKIELDEENPYTFTVTIVFAENINPTQLARQLDIAESIIELEKPAYTKHKLIPDFPSMQIGERSTIGVDTLLGTARSQKNED